MSCMSSCVHVVLCISDFKYRRNKYYRGWTFVGFTGSYHFT